MKIEILVVGPAITSKTTPLGSPKKNYRRVSPETRRPMTADVFLRTRPQPTVGDGRFQELPASSSARTVETPKKAENWRQRFKSGFSSALRILLNLSPTKFIRWVQCTFFAKPAFSRAHNQVDSTNIPLTEHCGLPDKLHRTSSGTPVTHVGTSIPPWQRTLGPIKGMERLFASKKRREIQDLIEKCDSQLRSPLSLTLAKSLSVVAFDQKATTARKNELLRHTSGLQQAFIGPIAQFLEACMSWRSTRAGPLPAEAERMIKRLNEFVIFSATIRHAEDSASLGPKSSEGRNSDADVPVFGLPQELRDRFKVLAEQTSQRVAQNLHLYRRSLFVLALLNGEDVKVS